MIIAAMGHGEQNLTEAAGAIQAPELPRRYGISTGWESALRGDYPAQIEAARRFSTSHMSSRRSRGASCTASGLYLFSAAAADLDAFESATLHGPAKRLLL